MYQALRHRGSDDRQAVSVGGDYISLGIARLAIIDVAGGLARRHRGPAIAAQGCRCGVSLCRVGDGDLPVHDEQIHVRLIDQSGVNDNLEFVLLDTVRAIEQLRREGGPW